MELTEAEKDRIAELVVKGWPNNLLSTAEKVELRDLAFKIKTS